ncbi:MAG: hypothetical protein JST93_10730 [Acidobacteria bacterium]|nr:hypothetical protein [Acidobacteriota bacterium]
MSTSVLALAMAFSLPAQDPAKFFFAVIGDMPYNPFTGDRQTYPSPPYERLIKAINDDRARFTVHIGDIKGGATRCEDEVYLKNLEYFNTFQRPLIFTPGDNEWTDCHRDTNGIFDPIKRLEFLRATFYPDDKSLGRRKMDLTRQSSSPGFSKFRENAIWKMGAVLFVTLHQPGSNNNFGRLTGEFPDLTNAEYIERNRANMAWLDYAFEQANADPQIKGVAIFSQANPFERFLETATPPYPSSGYADFISNLRNKVVASNKKVVYFGGDTHYFRIDKPLTNTYPAPNQLTTAGTRIMNFTRVEVFAQNEVHYILVQVDATDPDLFIFKPVLVPGN